MPIRLFAYRSSLRFLLPIAAFVFSAVVGIAFAAWVDAPNAPPNYGIVGCTPPCTQEDFQPMNLSTTPQTKRASATFEGDVTGNKFSDRQNNSYFIDPYSPLSGVLNGALNISQTDSGGAKLVVNYPSTPTKTGAFGDAVYAYANSDRAVFSAEQANPAGYAVYASGGINYFEGDVQVGSVADPKNLCLNGNCKTAWPSGVWTVSGNDIYNANSGNVGIGTAAPVARLNVEGGDVLIRNGGGATSSLGNLNIRNDNQEATAKTYSTGNTSDAILNIYSVPGDNYMRYFDIAGLGNGNGTQGGSTIRFLTNPAADDNGVARMVINSTGNVGIGTAAPEVKLDVNGHIRAAGSGATASGAGVEIQYNGGVGYLFTYDRTLNQAKATRIGGNGITGLHIDAVGNVGIGTTDPQGRLDVVGDIRGESNNWGSLVEIGSGFEDESFVECPNGYYLTGVAYDYCNQGPHICWRRYRCRKL